MNFEMSDLGSFIVQLVATLIGAFVGFGLVIAWDRKKKQESIQETRTSVVNSIKQELEENRKGLEELANKMPSWHISEGRFKGNFGLASTPAYESAVGGGIFFSFFFKTFDFVFDLLSFSSYFCKFIYSYVITQIRKFAKIIALRKIENINR